MHLLHYSSAALLTFQFTGCNDSFVNSSLEALTSQSGANITEAVFWDLNNGDHVVIYPAVFQLLKQGEGSTFIQQFRCSGLSIRPVTSLLLINQRGAIGVNLLRNDNQSIWRYTQITPQSIARA